MSHRSHRGAPSSSPREDIGTVAQKFKKSYIDENYGVEEAEKKYAEWDKLMQQLFIRRK
jgi:hypothetical protein